VVEELAGEGCDGHRRLPAPDCREIRSAVPEIVALVEEARRQAEIRHQEYLVAEDRRKREEDRRRIEESTKLSREALGQVIERWADRMAVGISCCGSWRIGTQNSGNLQELDHIQPPLPALILGDE